jgi:hypothetical protein
MTAVRLYLADRIGKDAARATARVGSRPSQTKASATPSLLAIQAWGLRKALKLILWHRKERRLPLGNLVGWITVVADIAAALHPDLTPEDVAAQCVWIGLPDDMSIITVVARGAAAARRVEGDNFRIMDAEAIGKAVELTAAEREGLGITKIGSIDETPEDRRRRQKREAARRAREARGLKPRTSFTGPKPWEREGVSRSTYYKRRSRGGPKVGGSLKNTKFYVQSDFSTNVHVASDDRVHVQSDNAAPITSVYTQSESAEE